MSYTAPRILLSVFVVIALVSLATAQTAPTSVTFNIQTYNTGPSPIALVSGDFNEDGLPDLAVIDDQTNTVNLLINQGGGLFSLGSQTNTGLAPVQIVTGNFTLTGHQDLAVANAGDNTMTILLGHGDGTFTTQSFPLSALPMAMVGGDFLHNNLTQLAVVECAGRAIAPCSLNVYQSDSTASFSRSQSIPLPAAPLFSGLIASADFTDPRRPGIALAVSNEVLVFANISSSNAGATARFALRTTIAPPNADTVDGLAAGHFDDRPGADLAIEVFDNGPDNTNSDYIFLNEGFGHFVLTSKVSGSQGFGHMLAVADINGDGIQDLLLLGTSVFNGDLQYALGVGGGAFSTPQEVAGFPGGVNRWLITGDFNLDSGKDLAVASMGPLGGPAFVAVLLNQNSLP